LEKDTSSTSYINTLLPTSLSVSKSSDGSPGNAVGSSFSVLSKIGHLVRQSLDLRYHGQTYEHEADYKAVLHLTSVEYVDSGEKCITLSTCDADDALFLQRHFKLAGWCVNEHEHVVRLDFVESILVEQGIKVVRGIKKI